MTTYSTFAMDLTSPKALENKAQELIKNAQRGYYPNPEMAVGILSMYKKSLESKKLVPNATKNNRSTSVHVTQEEIQKLEKNITDVDNIMKSYGERIVTAPTNTKK